MVIEEIGHAELVRGEALGLLELVPYVVDIPSRPDGVGAELERVISGASSATDLSPNLTVSSGTDLVQDSYLRELKAHRLAPTVLYSSTDPQSVSPSTTRVKTRSGLPLVS